MSALGQKQKYGPSTSISALPAMRTSASANGMSAKGQKRTLVAQFKLKEAAN